MSDRPASPDRASGSPRLITVAAAALATDRRIQALVEATRAQADAFVFLSGGASKMPAARERALLGLFDALAMVVRAGVRLAVGDGGTHAGIMQASGRARVASDGAFPLIGVSPAREILPRGDTAPDPHHTAIVAVDNPEWDGTKGYFGSETAAMYELFARLAEGRPSVTLVANGGELALREVDANIEAGRRMILIAGSGRAADALVALLGSRAPDEQEVAELYGQAARLHLARRPELLEVFELEAGPHALARVLTRILAPSR